MLDLTNYEHKRGLMILNSKDVRMVDKSLFNWRVNTDCVDMTIKFLIKRLENEELIQKDTLLGDLRSIQKWVNDSQKNIDKARSVFQ